MKNSLPVQKDQDSDDELTQAEREQSAEMDFLARKLAEKYQQRVRYYLDHEKLSVNDAVTRADQSYLAYYQQLSTLPARDLTWFHLNTLPEDSGYAVALWQEIKQEALDRVTSGTYALSDVIEKSPFEQGIYLAVRSSFQDQWKPQNGGEQLLVDQLTMYFCQQLYWLHRLEIRTNLDREVEDGNVKHSGKWKPALDHSTTPEWLETTTNMIERFHRMFLRTLRALRDLRRSNVNVIIPTAGQVNIGQDQVNTAHLDPKNATR